jgi:hypothetical protein
MRKLFLSTVLLLASVCAWGQGVTVLFPPAVNQNGGGLSFATITFCTLPTTISAAGVCQTPTSVFKDQALTPGNVYSTILTDGIGYFPPNANTATALWFSPPNNYCFTVTTSNMLSPATNPCTPFSVSVAPGSNPAFTSVTLSGFLKLTETTAPACAVGFDFIWGDSTAHRAKGCNNNGSALQYVLAGVDINNSDQVTATHLAAALPVAQGGTGVTSAQGNGSKVQLSTGAVTTNVVTKFDANGNTVNSSITDNGTVVSFTEPLNGATLQGAGSGNAVTLLNPQDTLGNITGNGTDQTVYTFTIPANTIQAGKGLRLTFGAANNNAVAVTYKFTLGTTTALTLTTAAASQGNTAVIEIFNNAGVQTAQVWTERFFDGATILSNNFVTSAENMANALTLKVTANEVNPNTITPRKWIVELIQ